MSRFQERLSHQANLIARAPDRKHYVESFRLMHELMDQGDELLEMRDVKKRGGAQKRIASRGEHIHQGRRKKSKKIPVSVTHSIPYPCHLVNVALLYVYVHVCLCMSSSMSVCIYVRVCMCLCVYLYACTCACIWGQDDAVRGQDDEEDSRGLVESCCARLPLWTP
jgi:hypothetical protein